MSSSRAWWQRLQRVGNSTKGGFVVFDLTFQFGFLLFDGKGPGVGLGRRDIVAAMKGKETGKGRKQLDGGGFKCESIFYFFFS